MKIIAPMEERKDEGDSFIPGQHVGHVARECAAVLAKLMDEGFACECAACDSLEYLSGFTIACILSNCCSNRSTAGYPIEIVFFSNISPEWVNSLANFLSENAFKPTIMKH